MIDLEKNIINKALQIALDNGLDFAELYCEKTATNSISLENNKIEKVRSGIDNGTGFRIIHKNIVYYGHTNSLAEKDILKLAKEVTAAAKGSNSSKKIKILKELKPKQAYKYQKPPAEIATKEKVDNLTKANKTARDYNKNIKQVAVGYADTTQDILIANSLGALAHDHRIRTNFVTQVIANKNKITETGYESEAGAQGLEILDKRSPETIALTAAKRAIINLNADLAPAGKMTVVLAGDAGGTMVHEACGHALEADFIYKKISIFDKNQLGKKVVSPLITVVDDGTLAGHYGTSSFDDEATPRQKNILINKGMLTGFMSDYLNAKMLNLKPSGNGRRQSYKHTPLPRMTNTYIAPGKSTYKEILSTVKEGILVMKMGGGQVDITNGNFVFEITEGYRIKNGKQGSAIRGATLVGNGIDVLKNVSMVGNDLHFIPGTCGKGQAAPVTDGQPTLLIPEIIVGGHQ